MWKGKNLEAADSSYKIAKLNVSYAASHVGPSDIDIGFAAKATVDKALIEKKVSQLQVLEFKKECEVMLQTTVSKIQERSPLKYNLARKLVRHGSKAHAVKSRQCYQNVSTSTTDTNWKGMEDSWRSRHPVGSVQEGLFLM